MLFLTNIVLLGVFCAEVVYGTCEFSCPHGYQKRPSEYPPEVNGCGGQGSINLNSLFPAFTEICNAHDRCYGTCGSPKAYCDNEFWQGMMEYCETWRKHSIDFYRDCRTLASTYATGVKVAGCSFYIDGQKSACTCTRSRSL